MKVYKVRWREVSYHDTTLTAESIATMLGCSVEQVEKNVDQAIADSTSNLQDELGGYSDQGFLALYRDRVQIEEAQTS